jgi:hypothetical protein
MTGVPTEGRPAADDIFREPDRPPPAGPVTNLMTAAAVVITGGAAFVGSLGLGVGTPAAPGSGTWPTLVSACLIVLGLALAVRARRTADAERFVRSGLPVVAAVASMVVYVAVIATTGFEIPAALLAFVWLRFLGRERWLTSVIISIAIVVALYVLFVGALDVTIPHLF